MISFLESKVQCLISSFKQDVLKAENKSWYKSDCSLQFSDDTAKKRHISQRKVDVVEKFGFTKVAY